MAAHSLLISSHPDICRPRLASSPMYGIRALIVSLLGPLCDFLWMPTYVHVRIKESLTGQRNLKSQVSTYTYLLNPWWLTGEHFGDQVLDWALLC